MISVELFAAFFNESLLGKDFFYLKHEGYECIKNIFLLMNERKHLIQMINTEKYVAQNYSQQTSSSGATLTSSSNISNENPEEYITYVNPKELIGIEIFYNIILTCQDITVVSKAIEILFHLHTWISTLLDNMKTKIEEDFVENCINHIDE